LFVPTLVWFGLFAGAAITTRGVYVPPGRKVIRITPARYLDIARPLLGSVGTSCFGQAPDGERKLFLTIEGSTAMMVLCPVLAVPREHFRVPV
jgi:hypothetical protein